MWRFNKGEEWGFGSEGVEVSRGWSLRHYVSVPLGARWAVGEDHPLRASGPPTRGATPGAGNPGGHTDFPFSLPQGGVRGQNVFSAPYSRGLFNQISSRA